MGKNPKSTEPSAAVQVGLDMSRLPEDWNAVGFDHAICKGRVKIGKIKSSDYMITGRFPIIDQGQQFIAGYCDDEEGLHVEPLPVIVFGDHTRIFKYIDFPFLAGADGTQILVPNTENFDSLFLYYAFSFLSIPSRGYNRHFSLLKQKRLPQPPFPEQWVIAHVLRTVQRAKETTEKVIAAAQQLKQSLMHHLFTYGPVPFHDADQVELRETEIGEIPSSWQIESLGKITKVKTSTSPLRSLEQASPGTVQVFYLKVSDMNHPSNLRSIVTATTVAHISEIAAAKLNTVPRGATVLPKRGAAIATNKKRLTTCQCLLDPNLVAIIPGGEILDRFLYAWFEQFDLRTITDTTTLPQINKKDIEPLRLPIPSKSEQEEMIRTLHAIERKIETEESRCSALENLFDTLLHNLMTAQVRVLEFNVAVAMEAV